MAIPAFTDAERWVVQTTLKERYGSPPLLETAEAEVPLHAGDSDALACPVLFWSEGGAQFAIAKLGERRYRAQFFYSVYERYGTGREEWDDIAECVVTLLHLQQEHARARLDIDAAEAAGETAGEFPLRHVDF